MPRHICSIFFSFKNDYNYSCILYDMFLYEHVEVELIHAVKYFILRIHIPSLLKKRSIIYFHLISNSICLYLIEGDGIRKLIFGSTKGASLRRLKVLHKPLIIKTQFNQLVSY